MLCLLLAVGYSWFWVHVDLTWGEVIDGWFSRITAVLYSRFSCERLMLCLWYIGYVP